MAFYEGGSLAQGIIFNYDPAYAFSYKGSGNLLNDVSGNNYNSILNNVIFSNNNLGILSFNGSNSYVLGNGPFVGIGTTTKVSINMWVFFNSIGSAACLFDQWSN